MEAAGEARPTIEAAPTHPSGQRHVLEDEIPS
jgi:hypothetical protein